jgi:hypothetical protein
VRRLWRWLCDRFRLTDREVVTLLGLDKALGLHRGTIPYRCPATDHEAQCIEPEGHSGPHDFRYDYDLEEDEDE